jgi:hypothetical protein
MSTKTPPGGAQPATPSDRPSSLTARNAQLGQVYYLNGDAVQVTQKDEDGSVRLQMVTDWKDDGTPSSLGRPIRLEGNRKLMREPPTTVPDGDGGFCPPAARASAASAPVELPSGLTGTPKANPGGHLDRARIEAVLATMTDAELMALVQKDKRAFVASLVNNELARRETEAAKAPRAQATSAPSKIEWKDAAPPAPPRVSATTSASPPRGLPVASAPPPSYPSPPSQPKTPRSAPKAAPTPPAPPADAPSHPTDDRAARARAALAVFTKHAEALVECAAAYKELEALGLTAPRFM